MITGQPAGVTAAGIASPCGLPA